MEKSEIGVLIIIMIGVFGFASFLFEYLSARHSKKEKPRQR